MMSWYFNKHVQKLLARSGAANLAVPIPVIATNRVDIETT